MSLEGLTIAVTGSRRATEFARLIRSFGGTPYIAPTVGIETREDISKETKNFVEALLVEKVDYAVFMTGPGVYSLMSSARALGLEEKLKSRLKDVAVVCRSAKPRQALFNHGVATSIVPTDNTAKGIAKELLRRGVAGKSVAILWHGSYSAIIKDTLQKVGGRVIESSTYLYSLTLQDSGAKVLKEMGFTYTPPSESKALQLIRDLLQGKIGAATFTSPPAARNLVRIAARHRLKKSLISSLNSRVVVVAVGPPTRKTLEENGVVVEVMPQTYKMGPMLQALGSHLKKRNKEKIPSKQRVAGA